VLLLNTFKKVIENSSLLLFIQKLNDNIMNATKKRIKIETVNALSMSELEYIVENIKKMNDRFDFSYLIEC
jgi:hypothetical protein